MNKVKQWSIPLLIAILVTINVVVLTHFGDASQKLVEQQSTVIETKNTLRSIQGEKASLTSSLKETTTKVDKLQTENDSLKVKLQAKKDLAALAAQEASKPKLAAPVANISGDKYTWLAASGIPEENWWAVDYIVSRESGWNPCAYNPGKSNCGLTAKQVNETQGIGVACGLGQSLPCGKWGASWTDPVEQLKAMNVYVNQAKFGYTWAGAVAYWKANGHY